MWMWVGNNLQTLQLLSTLFMDTLKLYSVQTQAVKHSGHLEIKFAVLTFQHNNPKGLTVNGLMVNRFDG